MKKTFSIMICLCIALIFLTGCGVKEETQTKEVIPEPLPQFNEVDRGASDMIEEEPVVEPTVEEIQPPIRDPTMVKETSKETTSEEILEEAEEQDEPEEELITEIILTPEKTMSEIEKRVSKGTTLRWKNTDSWPHILAVETGSGFDTKRLNRSEELLENDTWEYTFDEYGTFLVRDIFSGKMRMDVIVE